MGLPGCSPRHTAVRAPLSSPCTYLQSLPQGSWFFSAVRPGPLNSFNVSPTSRLPGQSPFTRGPGQPSQEQRGGCEEGSPTPLHRAGNRGIALTRAKARVQASLSPGPARGLELQGWQQVEKCCSVSLSSQLGLRTPNPL